MYDALDVPFIAPIPVGHRVQIIRASRWESPLFGGEPSWRPVSDPILVDRDTGIIYAESTMAERLVLEPLAFKPNVGLQISTLTEAKVTACLVTTEGGERARLKTTLQLVLEPPGYRG
jgi:hypothetical protein